MPKTNAPTDVIKRMNFLYQAAHVVPSPLSRFYCDTMKRIATKSTLRLGTSIKSSICKCCSSLLPFGSSVRLKPKQNPHRVVSCTFCGAVKKYPTKLPRRTKKPTTTTERVTLPVYKGDVSLKVPKEVPKEEPQVVSKRAARKAAYEAKQAAKANLKTNKTETT